MSRKQSQSIISSQKCMLFFNFSSGNRKKWSMTFSDDTVADKLRFSIHYPCFFFKEFYLEWCWGSRSLVNELYSDKLDSEIRVVVKYNMACVNQWKVNLLCHTLLKMGHDFSQRHVRWKRFSIQFLKLLISCKEFHFKNIVWCS